MRWSQDCVSVCADAPEVERVPTHQEREALQQCEEVAQTTTIAEALEVFTM